MRKILINPFYLYSISWTITLVFYKINIIKVFPKLSLELEIFLILSILFSIFLGKTLRIKRIKFTKNFEDKILFIIIIIGWVLTFLYERKIPLIEAMRKTGYIYIDFKGIPTISPLIYTLTTYHSIKNYIQYLIFKEKKYLLYFTIEICFYLLGYRRGPILIIFIANFLSYVYIRGIKNLLLKGIIISFIVAYLFGILGNIRHGFSPLDTRMLKAIVFLNTEESFFDPLLWVYTYITSPLSNLQHTLEINNITFNIFEYIRRNFFLDFIQKRFQGYTNIKLLIPVLTVQTGYNSSIINLGMLGAWITYITYMSFGYLYLKLMKNTEYYFIILLLLGITNIFFIFDNMYVNSAIGVTIIYPLVFYILKKIIKNN
ncbi:Uncharacterised protein [Fusobacterium necrogenes]|uniref:Oligosaccharide repeat unit polymerase n=1 Tax=Fusobacterium necrogenes TaxID=858 RepID=A0A377GZ58_9FUSO|nr:O-antigen polymerase [Fusobacterium necrogenes]STO32269.1 Uncharacterised protein [Fusobacterium necrogenes]